MVVAVGVASGSVLAAVWRARIQRLLAVDADVPSVVAVTLVAIHLVQAVAVHARIRVTLVDVRLALAPWKIGK